MEYTECCDVTWWRLRRPKGAVSGKHCRIQHALMTYWLENYYRNYNYYNYCIHTYIHNSIGRG